MPVGFRPLDQLLAAIRPTKVDPKEIVGVSGTPAYAGWLVTSESNAKLTGRQRYQTYTDILGNIAIVGAAARYFLNLLSKAEWRVQANEDAGDVGKQAAEVVERAMAHVDTPWNRIIRRSGMFTFHGFAVSEWTAETQDDGTVLFSDIEARPQITIERWDIDESGKVAGFIQRAPRDFRVIYLPRQKCIYAVDDSLNDSPEGMGLFRHIAETARRLERYQDLEAFGFEQDLRGMPIVRAPFTVLEAMKKAGTMSAEAVDAILLPFRNFLTNHVKSPSLGMMLDSVPYTDQGPNATPSATQQWGVDLLKTDAGAQPEVHNAIIRLNEEIARVLGVEHLLLGGGPRGSNALSRDKSDNFALTIDATLSQLRSTFGKDMILPLMALNGIPEEAAPEFKTDAIAYRDIEQVTSALFQMAQAGAVLDPNDPAVDEVRDILGLSHSIPISLTGPVAQDAAGVKPLPGRKPAAGAPNEPLQPTGDRQRAVESDSGKPVAPDAAPEYKGPITANPAQSKTL